jgi:hypothetical protein
MDGLPAFTRMTVSTAPTGGADVQPSVGVGLVGTGLGDTGVGDGLGGTVIGIPRSYTCMLSAATAGSKSAGVQTLAVTVAQQVEVIVQRCVATAAAWHVAVSASKSLALAGWKHGVGLKAQSLLGCSAAACYSHPSLVGASWPACRLLELHDACCSHLPCTGPGYSFPYCSKWLLHKSIAGAAREFLFILYCHRKQYLAYFR